MDVYSVRIRLILNIKDVGYLNSIIDSYEGIGIVRTIDKTQGYVIIYSTNGLFKVVLAVLDALRDEGIDLTMLAVEKSEMVDEWN